MRLELIPMQSPCRAAAEGLVRDVYRSNYGADYPGFPDMMIAMLDGDGRPHCVTGFRDAADGLFSEQYLDAPVEAVIVAHTGKPVAREEIVEIGPLAARQPGALLALLTGVVRLGLGSGYRWGVFTGTSRLRQLASRLKLPLVDLGPARASRVANPAAWGSYYDCDPRVCAVDGIAARDSRLAAGPTPDAQGRYTRLPA